MAESTQELCVVEWLIEELVALMGLIFLVLRQLFIFLRLVELELSKGVFSRVPVYSTLRYPGVQNNRAHCFGQKFLGRYPGTPTVYTKIPY